MNIYDVLQAAELNTNEIVNRCIRGLRGAGRRSAREWLQFIGASFTKFEVKPSSYTMFAIVCPDNICRVFAIDTMHIDVNVYKKSPVKFRTSQSC